MSQAADKPPAWVRDAAREAAKILYREMERIDGEEMNDSQVAQDGEEGRYTWLWEVASIIEEVFHESIKRSK
jgi:hypothetical protein